MQVLLSVLWAATGAAVGFHSFVSEYDWLNHRGIDVFIWLGFAASTCFSMSIKLIINLATITEPSVGTDNTGDNESSEIINPLGSVN